MTVKGSGNIKAKPDLIVITMELTTATPEYAKTTERAAAELEALRKAIVSVGHEGQSLKTTDFNIATEYESYTDARGYLQQKFKGYSCTHRLKLEFSLDMKFLGKTLAAISASGAKPWFELGFSIKDKDAIQADLLEKAIANAAEKATILAKASGVSLGEIMHIDYSWGELRLYSDTNLSDETDHSMIASFSKMEIEPEDVEVNDTVTVVWNIQ